MIPETIQRADIAFRVFIPTGGGLGDCAHHYATDEYFRRLPAIKAAFPGLRVYAYVESKIPHVVRQIFDRDPCIDEVVEGEQILVQHGGWNWTNVDAFLRAHKVTPEYLGKLMPDVPPEVVHRRVVNRICVLMRFPRVRAISMDDFFQQWGLDIHDFPRSPVVVRSTPEDQADAESSLAAVGLTDSPLVMLHPFTADAGRAVLPITEWLRIAIALAADGYGIVLFGGPFDDEQARSVWRNPRVPPHVDCTTHERLGEKIALLRRCAGVVCVDGGLMSLAWMHRIPTVSVVSAARARLACNNTVAGYHWAVAAGEPFASRHVLDEGGHDGSWRGESIAEELQALIASCRKTAYPGAA